MGKLTVKFISTVTKAGRYADADGLYLVVNGKGGKSWVLRYQKNKKRRDFGLGSAKKITLANVRKLANEMRAQIEAGLDPIMERRKADGIPTFREAAAKVYVENKDSWRNKQHIWQWMASLEKFAFPTLGDMPVNEIDIPAVRNVLVAIWLEKNATAIRVRQRINMILDWSVAKGYREAPLAMTVINKSLPKLPRGHKKHHKDIPYNVMPQFMQRLRQKKTISALALEAAILCATRSNEVRLAVWSEIDFANRLWTIPAQRMGKRNVEHVIPLSDSAIAVFEAAKQYRIGGSDLIFQGQKMGKPLSDMTLIKILRDMGLDETVHGCRTSFKDWASEKTNYPREVSEAALHHAIKNQSEAAYRRGTLLEKRRGLMSDWANHCDSKETKIVSLVK